MLQYLLHTAHLASAAAGDEHKVGIQLALVFPSPVVAAVVIVNADVLELHVALVAAHAAVF